MNNLTTINQGGGLSPLSLWIRHRTIAYLTGKGIIFGAGAELFPRKAVAYEKYAIYTDIANHPLVAVCDDELSMFADGEFRYVFVGERLGIIRKDPKDFLAEATRKLEVGGHLIIALPITSTPPRPFNPTSLRDLMGSVGSWTLKDTYERDGWFIQIYKKHFGPKGVVDRKPTTKPRACVARYGAIGDMIMVTPLLKRLHEDGFEVTVNLSPYSLDVLKHNPYVDNVILQEKEAIPNHTLGQYWAEWAPDYDRYINLSESIEGALLKVENRRDFFTHQSWRHEQCNKNYYDYTMAKGGYPEALGTRGELFFSRGEEKEARWFRNKHTSKFLVLWALNGSSHHKKFPLMQPLLTEWLSLHPDAVVCTMGDHRATEMEFDHPQVLRTAGTWSLRTSFSLIPQADLVIGPESAIINAAGCFNTPKIPLLSHSTHENLCKYFINDYCLTPSVQTAPCYPCHQLHYSLESCPLRQVTNNTTNETSPPLPACTLAIDPSHLMQRMDVVYSKWKANHESLNQVAALHN